MNSIEKKSHSEGNLIVFDLAGNPVENTEDVYFLWYLNDGQYKVLAKTFNTHKETALFRLENLRKTYPFCGIGKWDLKTGQLIFVKPQKELENV